MIENELSYKIIGVAINLHRTLGPGLLESVYETAMVHDLLEAGLSVERQVAVPFMYKNIPMEAGYRIDILVEKRVILELKAIDSFGSGTFCADFNLPETVKY